MRLTTGSKDLDKFLGGYRNSITCIYGPAATGKTTMCLLAALEQAKYKKKILFLDTEQGFSVERAKQLCPEFKERLNHIFVLNPKTFKQQEEQTLKISKNFDLIIIDTIGSLYRLEIKKDKDKANDSLYKQLKHLIELKIPIIITNQVYSNFENNIKVIGGKMVEKFSYYLIKLGKNPRKIMVEKPVKKESLFDIKEEGVSFKC